MFNKSASLYLLIIVGNIIYADIDDDGEEKMKLLEEKIDKVPEIAKFTGVMLPKTGIPAHYRLVKAAPY